MFTRNRALPIHLSHGIRRTRAYSLRYGRGAGRCRRHPARAGGHRADFPFDHGGSRSRRGGLWMTSVLALDRQVVLGTGQVSCNLEGEEVILDLRTGVYHGLDPVGSHIWQLLHEERSVAELRDAVLAEFEVEEARCESELLTFLDELVTRGWIRVLDTPANE
jgi:hypothetical protein